MTTSSTAKFFVRSYQPMCAAPSFQTVRKTHAEALAAARQAPRYFGGRVVIDTRPESEAGTREVVWGV